jgi:hypothetical protein
MSSVKLTPELLKRMVLEEKKKLESKKSPMMDKAALKDMHMDMDEGDWSSPPPHAVKRTHATSNKVKQDGHGAGDVAQYKTLKKLEESLIARLEQIRENKQILRDRIIARR